MMGIPWTTTTLQHMLLVEVSLKNILVGYLSGKKNRPLDLLLMCCECDILFFQLVHIFKLLPPPIVRTALLRCIFTVDLDKTLLFVLRYRHPINTGYS